MSKNKTTEHFKSSTKIQSKLKRLLKSIGNSEKEVANFLRKNRIKGKLGSHDYCPIANYLISKGFSNLSVNSLYISTEDLSTGIINEINTPFPVARFICLFDCSSLYEDLRDNK